MYVIKIKTFAYFLKSLNSIQNIPCLLPSGSSFFFTSGLIFFHLEELSLQSPFQDSLPQGFLIFNNLKKPHLNCILIIISMKNSEYKNTKKAMLCKQFSRERKDDFSSFICILLLNTYNV